jgi:hypothetical protein
MIWGLNALEKSVERTFNVQRSWDIHVQVDPHFLYGHQMQHDEKDHFGDFTTDFSIFDRLREQSSH